MSMIFLEGKEATSLQANEIKPPNNECANALNQLSEFRAEAVYGSPLEDAWHPAAFYKLIHRMRQLQVIQREFRDRAEDWIFEFVELKGGRTVAFVGNKIHRESACRGPNAFFVLKKD
ncbi:MAG: hypothetical protein ACPGRS_11010 [bacterium]